ncbi:MAG: hypothetical protein M1821_006595 [Bathelium mastoideum]|nr:MAG: hypothetical protein M1821_006595 [Bathelium mastoideum]
MSTKRRRLAEDEGLLEQSALRNKRRRTSLQSSVPREHFTVAWVCAIPQELTAAQEVLDEEYPYTSLLSDRPLNKSDSNIYTLGRIGEHNVVIVHLARYGTNSAAEAATALDLQFPNIRIRLMVGIGGGIPGSNVDFIAGPSQSSSNHDHHAFSETSSYAARNFVDLASGTAESSCGKPEGRDIRLGDVVVSRPTGEFPGVVQYDLMKSAANGATERIGSLAPPPNLLLKAATKIQANHLQGRIDFPEYLPNSVTRPESDILFEAAYNHEGGSSCDMCTRNRLVPRKERPSKRPHVHYGTIASGNRVIKDGAERVRIRKDLGDALCFEMESAGLMNSFPCLVIRGICDYSDTHKNKEWQPFAAAVAAAYAKELLSVVPPAHQGETTAQTRLQPPMDGKQASQAFKSLWFPELMFRINDITDESYGTCRWLLQHANHKTWLAGRTGLLWIKGKPGAGKSTIMKYALNEEKRLMATHNGIVASFFFHARAGTGSLQTKFLGLCQSMLYQILSDAPELLHEFVSKFEHVLEIESQSAERWQKHENELRSFLKFCITRASMERSVCLYIDALDESGEKVAREIVKFFNRLIIDSADAGGSLHICFSCRHYPGLELPNSLKITLEDENNADIATFIQTELTGRDEALELRNKILWKSRGVFQWAAIVVGMIIELFEDGEHRAMENRLKGVPEGLDALYDDMLRKLPMKGQHALRVWVLQWFCYSSEPLTHDQLRWIMVLTPPSASASIDELRNDLNFCATDSQVEQRVRSLTGGLVEFISSEQAGWFRREFPETPTYAQFIHQSVQDYLVQTGIERLGETSSKGQVYVEMSRACLRYLSMLTVKDRSYPFGHWNQWDGSPSEERELGFSALVSSSWIEYACAAERENTSAHALLQGLHHLISQSPSSPRRVRRKGYSIDSVKIGPEAVLEEVRQERYFVNPLKPGSEALLLAVRLGLNSLVGPILMQYRVDTDFKTYNNSTVLHIAVYSGRISMIQTMLKHSKMGASRDTNDQRSFKINPNFVDEQGRTPLALAVAVNQKDMVRVLLQWPGVMLNTRDSMDRSPLDDAAIFSRTIIAELLLAHDEVDAGAQDHNHRTALSKAAEAGSIDILPLLLTRNDVSADSRDRAGRTPLSWAAGSGHLNVVLLLMGRRDVHIDSKDDAGRTPLLWAVRSGHLDIVRALMERRDVHADSKDAAGRTPLSRAAGSGHLDIVRALMKRKDVRADSKDAVGRTPLSWAAGSGHLDIVQALIERRDIYADSKDIAGRTPLSWAAGSDHPYIVLLLIGRRDVHADSKDATGRTPLSWAAGSGCQGIVRALIERRDVHSDSKDVAGKTPSFWAVVNDQAFVVATFLENCLVDADSRTSESQAPFEIYVDNYRSRLPPGKRILGVSFFRMGKGLTKSDVFGKYPIQSAAIKRNLIALKNLFRENEVEIIVGNRTRSNPYLFLAEYDGTEEIL